MKKKIDEKKTYKNMWHCVLHLVLLSFILTPLSQVSQAFIHTYINASKKTHTPQKYSHSSYTRIVNHAKNVIRFFWCAAAAAAAILFAGSTKQKQTLFIYCYCSYEKTWIKKAFGAFGTMRLLSCTLVLPSKLFT